MTTEQQTTFTCTMTAARVAELGLGLGLRKTREATIDLGNGAKRHRIVTMDQDPRNARHIYIRWIRVCALDPH
jgi:hypothetical protein